MKGTIIAPVGYYRKPGSALQWEPMGIMVQSWFVSGNAAIAVREFKEATPELDLEPSLFAAVIIQLCVSSRYARHCFHADFIRIRLLARLAPE